MKCRSEMQLARTYPILCLHQCFRDAPRTSHRTQVFNRLQTKRDPNINLYSLDRYSSVFQTRNYSLGARCHDQIRRREGPRIREPATACASERLVYRFVQYRELRMRSAPYDWTTWQNVTAYSVPTQRAIQSQERLPDP